MGLESSKVYKVVLTGGPCGGKTTAQVRLTTFFEGIGWKVLRVPEMATLLYGGGIVFQQLNEKQTALFYQRLSKTLIELENTFIEIAAASNQKTLIIFDRGFMDAVAYMPEETVKKLFDENKWNRIGMSDSRYDQVIHMVTAANGAEAFYTTSNNPARSETIQEAKEVDNKVLQAWVGHPHLDVVQNIGSFDSKCNKVIGVICSRLGISAGDGILPQSRKRRFLIDILPDDSKFPPYQDFEMIHNYLVNPEDHSFARLTKRGQNGVFSYMYTKTMEEINHQSIKEQKIISEEEYKDLMNHADPSHSTVFKTRRCFVWKGRYFQLDIYRVPFPPRCQFGLLLLSVYTTRTGSDELPLPSFLKVEKEVTDDSAYSMWFMTKKTSGNYVPKHFNQRRISWSDKPTIITNGMP